MNMLSKFIIIENNKDYQCNTFEDVVKYFIDENYYEIERGMKAYIYVVIENC